ncbi:SPFH domain-containing protein [Streptomyces sp. B1I3]|uniref:SPFH domain-containing protein n=1 Tax=Streptomyces sp. B1I3 TaxID=3042264 RepID=UPI002785B354|nr:SPFH domain-containing protein [Streptomyces sp. B1I3]MDQ0796211.1 hypothetical protein [Streptomyces sp. B1I3]
MTEADMRYMENTWDDRGEWGVTPGAGASTGRGEEEWSDPGAAPRPGPAEGVSVPEPVRAAEGVLVPETVVAPMPEQVLVGTGVLPVGETPEAGADPGAGREAVPSAGAGLELGAGDTADEGAAAFAVAPADVYPPDPDAGPDLDADPAVDVPADLGPALDAVAGVGRSGKAGADVPPDLRPVLEVASLVREWAAAERAPVVRERPVMETAPEVRERPVMETAPEVRERPVMETAPEVRERATAEAAPAPAVRERATVETAPAVRERVRTEAKAETTQAVPVAAARVVEPAPVVEPFQEPAPVAEPAHVEPTPVVEPFQEPAPVAEPAHVDSAPVMDPAEEPAPVVEPAHVDPAPVMDPAQEPAPVAEQAQAEPAHAVEPAPVVEPAPARAQARDSVPAQAGQGTGAEVPASWEAAHDGEVVGGFPGGAERARVAASVGAGDLAPWRETGRRHTTIAGGTTAPGPVHLSFRGGSSAPGDAAAPGPRTDGAGPRPPAGAPHRPGVRRPPMPRSPLTQKPTRPAPTPDPRLTERPGPVLPGWAALLTGTAGTVAGIAVLGWHGALPTAVTDRLGIGVRPYDGIGIGAWALLALLATVVMLALGGLGRGLVGYASVLTLFGDYRGSIRRTGLIWASPLLLRRRVDVRLRHWRSEPLPVVDASGTALRVVVLVVWRVRDTARATLGVADHEQYLRDQVEAVMARVLSQLPADAFDGETRTLRDAEAVGNALTRMLKDDCSAVGIEVYSAQPTGIEYAPEVAAAMQRRRVAAIDAKHRDSVLTSVVDAVDDTVSRLTSRGIVELDDYEHKALVRDLTVAFYTGRGGGGCA